MGVISINHSLCRFVAAYTLAKSITSKFKLVYYYAFSTRKKKSEIEAQE